MAPIRKINPKIIPEDTCQKSLNWLETHVQSWLSANVKDVGEIWFADENATHLTSKFPKNTKNVEVVFTGSFLLRFLESGLWPFENYRIWVLSHRVKNIFVAMFHIPEERVGVIGRSLNYDAKERPLGNNFIYAGRLSFTKNIIGLLHLVSCLQVDHALDVTLDLYGAFDDFPDESLGRYLPINLKESVTSLIAGLPWTEKPVMHGEVAQGEWLKVNRANPTFISLSTSMYEDYGTAAQMAHEAGWPCLLSDWGGHSDASAYLMPTSLIPQTFENEGWLKRKAEFLAGRIKNKDLQLNKASQGFIPQKYSAKELETSRNTFMKKWGPEILLCLREKMNFFADTPKGTEFFHHYRNHLSDRVQQKNLFIVNDLVFPIRLPRDLNSEFEMISLREVFNPFFLKRYHSYKRILLIEMNEEIPALMNFFKKILGLSIEIETWKP